MSLIVCRCDAQAYLCVVIEQGFGTNAMDTVLVDMSTLRHNSIDKASKPSMLTMSSTPRPVNAVCMLLSPLLRGKVMLCQAGQGALYPAGS